MAFLFQLNGNIENRTASDTFQKSLLTIYRRWWRGFHTSLPRDTFSLVQFLSCSNFLCPCFKTKTTVLSLAKITPITILFGNFINVPKNSTQYHYNLIESFTIELLKNGPIPASFSVYFRLVNMSQLKFKFTLINV